MNASGASSHTNISLVNIISGLREYRMIVMRYTYMFQVRVTLNTLSDIIRLEISRLSDSSSARVDGLNQLNLNSSLYMGGEWFSELGCCFVWVFAMPAIHYYHHSLGTQQEIPCKKE